MQLTALSAAVLLLTGCVNAWAPAPLRVGSLGRRGGSLAPARAVCDVANVDEAAATATTLRSLVLTGADGEQRSLDDAMGVSTKFAVNFRALYNLSASVLQTAACL